MVKHWMVGLMALGFVGCAGGTPAQMEGSWRLEGTRLIGCCCNAPCSCRINKPPSYMHGCDSSTAVQIDRGHINGVKMVGYNTGAGRLAASASSLYAKNLLNFLDILVDKKEKKLAVNWDDEIVKATALTKDGAVVHPSFQPKSAA